MLIEKKIVNCVYINNLYQVDLAGQRNWLLEIFDLSSQTRIFELSSSDSSSPRLFANLQIPLQFLDDKLIVQELQGNEVVLAVWDYANQRRTAFDKIPRVFEKSPFDAPFIEVKPLQLVYFYFKNVKSGFEGETISNKTQVQTIASFHNYLII